ncbi:(deoxy)nucleoside triphosphate pyrophosphohydrolase [Pseudonocardiaceae bacterium YIM PH 21723]|nr:(deoxy)nucleoside triphosphate pyrophosphohydrolase [Pseudonocardiaceae bacterium YIM PH 21723]
MSEAVVVSVALVHEGLLLAAQRSEPPSMAGKWELPGGKVEQGESDADALARECLEELGATVLVGEKVGPDLPLNPPWVLRTYAGSLTPGSAAPQALEHLALRWLSADELDDVDWLDADWALLPDLRKLLNSPSRPTR